MGKLIGPVTVGYVEKPDTVWISVDAPREQDDGKNCQS